MGAHHTGVVAFDNGANSAEAIRQQGVATASGTGAALQANVTAVEIAYFKTLRSLGLANGISVATFNDALKSLGVS
jgi:hypothetical protein